MLWLVWTFCLLLVCNGATVEQEASDTFHLPSSPDIRHFYRKGEAGEMHYGYAFPGQSHLETRNPAGDVTGTYTYQDPTGKDIRVSYIADDGGFRITGSNLPKPAPILPPGPVHDTPEVQAARRLHLMLFDHARALAEAAPDDQPVEGDSSDLTDVVATEDVQVHTKAASNMEDDSADTGHSALKPVQSEGYGALNPAYFAGYGALDPAYYKGPYLPNQPLEENKEEEEEDDAVVITKADTLGNPENIVHLAAEHKTENVGSPMSPPSGWIYTYNYGIPWIPQTPHVQVGSILKPGVLPLFRIGQADSVPATDADDRQNSPAQTTDQASPQQPSVRVAAVHDAQASPIQEKLQGKPQVVRVQFAAVHDNQASPAQRTGQATPQQPSIRVGAVHDAQASPGQKASQARPQLHPASVATVHDTPAFQGQSTSQTNPELLPASVAAVHNTQASLGQRPIQGNIQLIPIRMAAVHDTQHTSGQRTSQIYPQLFHVPLLRYHLIPLVKV